MRMIPPRIDKRDERGEGSRASPDLAARIYAVEEEVVVVGAQDREHYYREGQLAQREIAYLGRERACDEREMLPRGQGHNYRQREIDNSRREMW